MAAATTSSGGWRSRRRDGRQPFIPELDCLKEPEHDERCGFDGLNDQDPMLPGHKESNKEYHRPGRNRGEAREIDNSVRGVIAFGGQEHHNAGKDEHSDGRVAVRVCVEAGWPPSVPEEPNHHDQAAAKRGPPKLVITSPPYPGVHVLYHRWQVDGRKEAPLPFMIANKLDGAFESFYTMGDRKYPRLRTYFENIRSTMSSVAILADTHTVIVQMVGFSEPKWQLPPLARNHGGSRLAGGVLACPQRRRRRPPMAQRAWPALVFGPARVHTGLKGSCGYSCQAAAGAAPRRPTVTGGRRCAPALERVLQSVDRGDHRE